MFNALSQRKHLCHFGYLFWTNTVEQLVQTKLCNAFTSRLLNLTKTNIPGHLKALEKIPMGHLTETLYGLRKIVKDNGTPDWVTMLLLQ